MHTNEYGGFTVHHNGDFSGDVRIDVPANARRDERPGSEARVIRTGLEEDAAWEIALPFEALKEIVAAWVAGERISKLEEASADEILTDRRFE